MYLHLGKDIIVNEEDIIGIFDLDNTTTGKVTKDYLATAEKNKEVVNVSTELPASFVVCDESENQKVYISQISSKTLLKRSEGFLDV